MFGSQSPIRALWHVEWISCNISMAGVSNHILGISVKSKSMMYNNFWINQSRFRLEVCSTKCWWCAGKRNCQLVHVRMPEDLWQQTVFSVCFCHLKHNILTSWRRFSFHPIYTREDWGMSATSTQHLVMFSTIKLQKRWNNKWPMRCVCVF